MSGFWRWILGIVAVLVAAITAIILLFEWNWLRSPVERRVSGLTGKHVSIEGPISGTWSWTPKITAGNVQISEPASQLAPKVATIGQMSVAMDLKRLLRGTI